MKRLLGMIGLLGLMVGITGLLHAGSVQDVALPGSGAVKVHSLIQGSSTTVASAAPTSLAVTAATAFNSAGQSFNYQNCFTKFVVQMSTQSSFTVYDGPVVTTNAVLNVYGGFLGTGVGNTISLPEDHLGPLCLTAGNTTNLAISTNSVVQGATSSSAGNTINYEGYTTCGAGAFCN